VNRFERRRRAYPYSVRALDLRQAAWSGSSDLRDLLRTRLGVRFNSYSSTQVASLTNRGRTMHGRVYLDEVPVPAAILIAYRPEEVALVEVYRNGEQIRIYTRGFMEWAALHHYDPLPLYLAS
jgi:hypothetical protein